MANKKAASRRVVKPTPSERSEIESLIVQVEEKVRQARKKPPRYVNVPNLDAIESFAREARFFVEKGDILSIACRFFYLGVHSANIEKSPYVQMGMHAEASPRIAASAKTNNTAVNREICLKAAEAILKDRPGTSRRVCAKKILADNTLTLNIERRRSPSGAAQKPEEPIYRMIGSLFKSAPKR